MKNLFFFFVSRKKKENEKSKNQIKNNPNSKKEKKENHFISFFSNEVILFILFHFFFKIFLQIIFLSLSSISLSNPLFNLSFHFSFFSETGNEPNSIKNEIIILQRNRKEIIIHFSLSHISILQERNRNSEMKNEK